MDGVLSLELKLEEEAQIYKEQLDTICVRLEEDSLDERESLSELKKTLEELLSITEERLLDVKKQKLLFAFSDQHEVEVVGWSSEGQEDTGVMDQDEEELGGGSWRIGDKCRAPLEQSWGAVDYHDAMVYSVHEDDMVCVLFLRPLYSKMKPCQFFLEGKCRYGDQQCRHSHGHKVPSSQLSPSQEATDVLEVGSRCLARDSDGLWTRGVVTGIGEESATVRIEGKNDESIFEHDAIHPLGDVEGEELSGCSSDEEEEVVVIASHHIAMATGFGEWEEHTKGIGSKLMAKMGYIPGRGLGREGNGRVDPVDIVILPERLSLDACVELREKGKLKRVDDSKKKTSEKNTTTSSQQGPHQDVFAYLNSALATPQQEETTIASLPPVKDRKELNIQMFKIQEEMKAVQKRIKHTQESHERNKQNSLLRKQIEDKLKQSEEEMERLQRKERALKTKFDSQKNRQSSRRIF